MTIDQTIKLTDTLQGKINHVLACLEEVGIAKRLLCQLYPDAPTHSKPQAAGIVLRRFFKRKYDLLQFLQMYEEDLKKGSQKCE